MDIVDAKNIAAKVTVRRATDSAAATAGGSGDATSVTGQSIDRAAIGMPLSAVAVVLWSATLASGATLSVATTVQEGPDGTNFSDFATAASTVVATGPSGGGTVRGQTELAVDLTAAREYIRLNFKPTHSATGTDTSISIGTAVLSGAARLPATV